MTDDLAPARGLLNGCLISVALIIIGVALYFGVRWLVML